MEVENNHQVITCENCKEKYALPWSVGEGPKPETCPNGHGAMTLISLCPFCEGRNKVEVIN